MTRPSLTRLLAVLGIAISTAFGALLTAWGTMLVVRGATDAYDSPPYMFYTFGGVLLIIAAVFFAPPVVLFVSRLRRGKRGAS